MSEVVEIQGKVAVLEHSVATLQNRVDAGFKELTAAIKDVASNLHSRPNPIPFKEILLTTGACLTIVAMVGGFLEWQYNKNTRIIEYRLEQLERQKAAMAPMAGQPFALMIPQTSR